jgi:hypothetical protein
VTALRPPPWEWSFGEEGSLALDRHELWVEPAYEPSRNLSQSRAATRLNDVPPSVTVTRMPPPRAPGSRRRARPRKRARRRVRRSALLFPLGFVLVVTLVVTAFGSASEPARQLGPSQTARLLPAGPPTPQIVAMHDSLRLQLPVAQQQLTAIGYHAAATGALPLEPLGRQGNRGLLGRIVDRILGSPEGTLVWYQLRGGSSTTALDVGAAPDTDVFSPVDGTVVGITDFVLNGKAHGVRVDIQPTSAPSLVVSVARLRRDPALTVGMTVVASGTRLGAVLDLSQVEEQALARHTQDAGNHVTVEVHPAETLGLP